MFDVNDKLWRFDHPEEAQEKEMEEYRRKKQEDIRFIAEHEEEIRNRFPLSRIPSEKLIDNLFIADDYDSYPLNLEGDWKPVDMDEIGGKLVLLAYEGFCRLTPDIPF